MNRRNEWRVHLHYMERTASYHLKTLKTIADSRHFVSEYLRAKAMRHLTWLASFEFKEEAEFASEWALVIKKHAKSKFLHNVAQAYSDLALELADEMPHCLLPAEIFNSAYYPFGGL